MAIRVLHVLPHAGGGGETYIDMLQRLEGFEHLRFYLSHGRTPTSALTSLPARWPRLPAAARRADVIHCHGDMASVIALPVLRARPAILTGQGLHMFRRLRGIRRRIMERALAGVISSCQAVICSSLSERDDLLPLTPPEQRDKLHVIYNGVDPPAPISETERAAVREELGVPPEATLGLFVGQLEPRKQPLLAAGAAVRASQLGAPIVLAVVGEGPGAPDLQRLAGDVVKLLGRRHDVPRLMAAADLFVQPSEREGMSFALLEALSSGLAIVAADASSNPEAVADAGLLFPPGDEEAFAAALHQLASDAELRRQLGGRATSRAAEHFGPAAFLGASESIYRSAITAPGRAVAGGRA